MYLTPTFQHPLLRVHPTKSSHHLVVFCWILFRNTCTTGDGCHRNWRRPAGGDAAPYRVPGWGKQTHGYWWTHSRYTARWQVWITEDMLVTAVIAICCYCTIWGVCWGLKIKAQKGLLKKVNFLRTLPFCLPKATKYLS